MPGHLLTMRFSLVFVAPLILAAACNGLSVDPIVLGPSDAGTDGHAGPAPIPIEFAPACAGGNWCWANPYPTGQDIVGIYAADRSHSLWAVDETGMIVRATTTSTGAISNWEVVYQPQVDIVATAIAGTDDSNIWVAYGRYLGKDADTIDFDHGKLGPGGVVHWNGSSWQVHPNSDEPITALWIAPDGALWRGGPNRVSAVSGSEAKWLLSATGALAGDVVAITGDRTGAVYAADAYGHVSQWNGKTGIGATFTALGSIDGARRTSALWIDGKGILHVGLEMGASSTDFNLASYGRSGSGWNLDGEVPGACRSAKTSRYARGKRVVNDEKGALFFGEASACSLAYGLSRYGAHDQDIAPFGVMTSTMAADSMTQSNGSPIWDLWIGGPSGSIGFRRIMLPEGNNGPLSWQVPSPGARAAPSDLTGVSVGRDGVVWALSGLDTGTNQVVRLDGSGALATAAALSGKTIFAFDRRNVWLGGEHWTGKPFPTLSHFDGSAWSEVALPSEVTMGTVRAIWGAAPDDIWAMVSTTYAVYTAPSALLHFDGSRWTVAETSNETHLAMGGTAANDVWFASSQDKSGRGTRIVRWDGTAKIDRSRGLPADKSFHTLVPVSANEAWALAYSDRGSIPYHFVDGEWHALPVPDVDTSGIGIRTMTVRGGRDVWFGGFRGMRTSMGETRAERSVLLHWDGNALTTTVDPTIGRMITAMATGPDGRIWAVGHGGTMVFRAP